jgi:hypothetical protein
MTLTEAAASDRDHAIIPCTVRNAERRAAMITAPVGIFHLARRCMAKDADRDVVRLRGVALQLPAAVTACGVT